MFNNECSFTREFILSQILAQIRSSLFEQADCVLPMAQLDKPNKTFVLSSRHDFCAFFGPEFPSFPPPPDSFEKESQMLTAHFETAQVPFPTRL